MKWFRFYNEVVDDAKVSDMPDKTYRIWTYLMCHTSELDLNGRFPASKSELAWRLRCKIDDISATLEQLSNLKIIRLKGDFYEFINWQKRQYKSDDINLRVKRYRKRYKPVTCNAPRTDTEQIQNRADTEKDILSGKPDRIPFDSIISYLNQKAKKNFSSKGNLTQRSIKARWNEGKRLEHFQKVVDIKVSKWATDAHMVDYLRPETLFGTKMDSYLNEKEFDDGTRPGSDMDRVEELRQKAREERDKRLKSQAIPGEVHTGSGVSEDEP